MTISGIKITTDNNLSQVELKKDVNAAKFEQKLEGIKEKGQISRAEFKDLAKKVVGGQKSLSEFLVKNNIVPAEDIKNPYKKPFLRDCQKMPK